MALLGGSATPSAVGSSGTGSTHALELEVQDEAMHGLSLQGGSTSGGLPI